MSGVLEACCSACTAARSSGYQSVSGESDGLGCSTGSGITGTLYGDELGAQEYAPGGDMYGVLAAAGGFLHEEQVAGGVLLPLLRALAALLFVQVAS